MGIQPFPRAQPHGAGPRIDSIGPAPLAALVDGAAAAL